MSQALTQSEIKLGSLDPVRDLSYVKDVAQAFIKVAESVAAVGETINIGSGKGISIGELAALILELLNCRKKVVTDAERIRPSGSEVMKLICDNSKALNLIGWKPAYSLQQGLAEVVEFVGGHLQRYKTDKFVL